MAYDSESILLGHENETKVLGDGYNINVDNIENKSDQELKYISYIYTINKN